MLSKNSVVAMFDQHTQAEEAVKQLQQAGIADEVTHAKEMNQSGGRNSNSLGKR